MNIIEKISYNIFYHVWNKKLRDDKRLLKCWMKHQLNWMKHNDRIDKEFKQWLKENIIDV